MDNNYKNLPTKWIITDTTGKILATDVSYASIAKVNNELIATYPNYRDNRDARLILAKCHYTIGSDGQKQYYTRLEEIPTATKCQPSKEYPFNPPTKQVYRYGAPQLAV